MNRGDYCRKPIHYFYESVYNHVLKRANIWIDIGKERRR
jgi:hypothetical protein